MDVRFKFFGAYELRGRLRLTMAKISPGMSTALDKMASSGLPGSNAASSVKQVADMMMLPRKVKIDLAIQSCIVKLKGSGDRYTIVKDTAFLPRVQ